MTERIVFDPLIWTGLIWALVIGAALAGLLAFVRLRRGFGLRVVLALLALVMLLNPSVVREERDPLPDVVVALVDRSQSMDLGDRRAGADAALEQVRAAVAADPGLDLIEADILPSDDGTRGFEVLRSALADAPRDRLAGALLITDGRWHDVPESLPDIGAPVHQLIVGDVSAGDRRLVVRKAPAYALVGQSVTFELMVEDLGLPPGGTARVTASVDGGPEVEGLLEVGVPVEISAPIDKRGPNVIELRVDAGPEELTLINNATAVSVTGVRDRLKVVLITGQPHAGARAWRDLLKSDPSVDLVHFTILRPPDKEDRTPREELNLIPFPTRELFEEKLDEFDLIIFDQYTRRGVLSLHYLDLVSRYVENGGALMIAAGPPYTTFASMYRTPLSVVLPGRPTGAMMEDAYRPSLSELGRRHPVTLSVAGQAQSWGRWARLIETTRIAGDALMEGPDGQPLLLVDRVCPEGRFDPEADCANGGRVALVLSDQAWLWARGVDGGGPFAELFRRLAHWLMKEPDLEEERLSARVVDGVMVAERRTLSDAPGALTVTQPDGTELTAQWTDAGQGLWRAEVPTGQIGLHQARSDTLSTVASAGPLNPREYADLRPTADLLRPLSEASGGGEYLMGEGAEPRIPSLRRVRANADASGRSWAGLIRNEAYLAREAERRPLLPSWVYVLAALMLAGLFWWREGRE